MMYFEKNSSSHIFAFLVNFFWMLEASDWLLSWVNQSEVSQNSKKFAKIKAKIWFDEFFWKYLITITNFYLFSMFVKSVELLQKLLPV